MKYLLVAWLLWYNGVEIPPVKYVIPNEPSLEACMAEGSKLADWWRDQKFSGVIFCEEQTDAY